MHVQTIPDIRAKKREYSYSLVRNRFQKYSKRSKLPYFESGALASLSGIEDQLYLSWMRPKVEKDIYKRILPHFVELPVSLPRSYNPVADWPQILEPVVKKPFITVSYVNRDSIDNLLSIKGKTTLGKVINLIQKEAEEKNWPLTKIEVNYEKDPEVKDWEYLVIVLDYNSSFEEANKYLNILYDRLDELADRLAPDEKAILTELIYIDIKTNDEISSS